MRAQRSALGSDVTDVAAAAARDAQRGQAARAAAAVRRARHRRDRSRRGGHRRVGRRGRSRGVSTPSRRTRWRRRDTFYARCAGCRPSPTIPGSCVDALGGAPGVREQAVERPRRISSARRSTTRTIGCCSSAARRRRDRRARYVCAAAYVDGSRASSSCAARSQGAIVDAAAWRARVRLRSVLLFGRARDDVRRGDRATRRSG